MHRLSPSGLGALVLAGSMACADVSSDDDVLVARVFDRQLRWSELRQVVPVDADPTDSAALAQAYITNWSRQQVLLERAERNLGEEQKEFDRQLRDYRNSLIIFAYEQALVDQKLDTTVTMAEVEEYF
ncbi:hypothetical protein RZS08_32715, partial [Arthrospira platensis SPKY1]|nr:hypothetical protein [Arthrospira platensis SPKY1]